MNFISNLFSKIVHPQGQTSSHDTQRNTNSSTFYTQTPSGANAIFVEEDYDSDDGFVLYSNAQPVKRCKVTEMKLHGRTEVMEYQQSSPTSYHPGLHLSSPQTSFSELTRRGPQPAVEKSFMTVSDVPMELSKHLQTVFNMSLLLADCSPLSKPNIDEYHYDFSFERSVLTAIDSHVSSVN